MSEYIIANGENSSVSTYSFTNGKMYKVLEWFHKSAKVRDDNGRMCYVSVGGPTLRLANCGRFERVSGHKSQYEVALGVTRGEGWKIDAKGMVHVSNNFIPSKVMYDHNGKQVDVKKACETLDALAKVLGVSDWSELELQAKIKVALADALVKLENSTKC